MHRLVAADELVEAQPGRTPRSLSQDSADAP
jgi:hypothetical protein